MRGKIFFKVMLILVLFLFLLGCETASDDDVAADDAIAQDEEELLETPGEGLIGSGEVVELIVGYAAGGGTDHICRALAIEMEDYLGIRINVSNITGASTAIAAEEVLSRPRDGTTWLGTATVHGTWLAMGLTDFGWEEFFCYWPVGFSSTIYVAYDAPWETLGELLDDIRENPTAFRYGSPGAGSNSSIFQELLHEMEGIEGVTHIPYSGGREAGSFLMAGEIQFTNQTTGDVIDYVLAKEIRPLANFYYEDLYIEGVLFETILHTHPEMEEYIPMISHFGINVPRDTPDPVLRDITDAYLYAIQQDSFIQAVDERGGILVGVYGTEADIINARTESIRGWGLYDVGEAQVDLSEFGVPRPEDYTWPPHERAEQARPWPFEE